MPISNAHIADLLRRFATVLALEGADRFKLKAYRRAADMLEHLSLDVAAMVTRGDDLEQLPGIGKALSSTITEIVRTGALAKLDQMLAQLKPEQVELAGRHRLDPKLVNRAYKKLGIRSLRELQQALDRGEVRNRLGSRVDYRLQRALEEQPRMLLWEAEKLAPAIETFLHSIPEVEQISRVGDLRRRVDMVGELAFLVASKAPKRVFEAFSKYGAVRSSEHRDNDEIVLRLSSDGTVSLTCCKTAKWSQMMVFKTGSDAHLAELKTYARANGRRSAKARIPNAKTETAVYDKLQLHYIEPELREGRGEVKAAAENRLPQLVRIENIRGDLHMHTTASDGANTLAEMAEAAIGKGYQYIAIADHSQSLKITNGLTERRLFQQIKAIDRLNSRSTKIRVLKSAEVDILEDGKLDYSNAALRQLDLTICSIHSRFALDREKQTERIMRAMDNRYFNILGHATGRLLLSREGYDLDIERLIRHAQDCGCYFEINSSPNRLDLSDENTRLAKDAGVKIAINTDAHSIRELNFMPAGLNQARRGWLEAADVLNALPVGKLLKLLRR